MFANLLRTGAFSSRFDELYNDDHNMHATWAYFMFFVLIFSSVVYVGVLYRDALTTGDVDSVD
jgi:hypothetical protein